MNFLRKEVQGEEMVQLARTGFGPQHNLRKNNAPVECVRQSELATASALVSLDADLIRWADQFCWNGDRTSLSTGETAAPLSCDLIGRSRSLAKKWAWKWIGSIRK
ncbi:hypothetical protein TNCV_3537751 [Trichonephila clavipes]|nr:hypothetical protein TNCV_3537751 [Trichonephila clavipes]